MVVTSGSGDGGFAGAPSYGSSGPHLALSRPGLWLYWLLLPLPSRFLRPSRAPASLPSHGTRTYEDSFIVDGADEAGPHRLVQWILDGWEVACSCYLSDPSCQFCRRLSRLPLDMVLQNLYRSLTVNCVGSYSDLT